MTLSHNRSLATLQERIIREFGISETRLASSGSIKCTNSHTDAIMKVSWCLPVRWLSHAVDAASYRSASNPWAGHRKEAGKTSWRRHECWLVVMKPERAITFNSVINHNVHVDLPFAYGAASGPISSEWNRAAVQSIDLQIGMTHTSFP